MPNTFLIINMIIHVDDRNEHFDRCKVVLHIYHGLNFVENLSVRNCSSVSDVQSIFLSDDIFNQSMLASMIQSDFVEFELYCFSKQLFAFLLKSDTPLCVVHQANIINRHKLPQRDHELIAMKTKRIIYVDTNPRLHSFIIHSFQNHFIFPLQIRTCN